jgi:hypothetical protein
MKRILLTIAAVLTLAVPTTAHAQAPCTTLHTWSQRGTLYFASAHCGPISAYSRFLHLLAPYLWPVVHLDRRFTIQSWTISEYSFKLDASPAQVGAWNTVLYGGRR